jgi:hypothetical protein
VLRCLLLFNGTNYCGFLTCIYTCVDFDFEISSRASFPARRLLRLLVISEKTTIADKERLIANYDDHLALYESQFRAYKTWLDEDAQGGSVLTASMEDRFAADIVDFEQTYQMWSFIR